MSRCAPQASRAPFARLAPLLVALAVVVPGIVAPPAATPAGRPASTAAAPTGLAASPVAKPAAVPRPATAARDYVPPRGEWARRAPAEAGFDAGRLAAAVALAQASTVVEPADLERVVFDFYSAREPDYRVLGPTRPRAGGSGLVIRGGHVIAEWGDLERADMSFSVTKTLLAAVAGFALGDGGPARLDEPVARFVQGPWFEGERHAAITWRHLLEQSSDWRGTLFEIHDWADRPTGATPEEWRNQPLHAPGTVYEYNDVRVNLLALALLEVLREPLPVVARERLMDPIGASPAWRWHGYRNSWVEVDGVPVQSVSGGGHFGGGLFVGTADLARLGLLLLREGRWGERDVLPRGWVAELVRPSRPKDDYGLLTWVNTERRAIPAAPASAFWAAGFGGNWLYVDPANDLVVVLRWVPQWVPVITAVLDALQPAAAAAR